MPLVSTGILSLGADEFLSRGLQQEDWLEGVPLTLEQLRDASSRIEWDLLAMLLDRAGELCGPRVVEEVARVVASRYRSFAPVAPMITTPAALYYSAPTR